MSEPNSAQLKPSLRALCDATESGRGCNEFTMGLGVPADAGRRIYIHEDSLADLATHSEEAAYLICRMVARVSALKAIHHHVQQDGVLLGTTTPARARQLAETANAAWSEMTSTALRRVGYRPSDPRRRADFYPLLGGDERVVATCYFSNYYTFATGERAAREMFLDTNDIAVIKSHVERGTGYEDMTLINGRALALIEPGVGVGPSKSAHYLRGRGEGLTRDALSEVKTKIRAEMQGQFDGMIRAALGAPSDGEAELLSAVKQSIHEAFTRGILKIHPAA